MLEFIYSFDKIKTQRKKISKNYQSTYMNFEVILHSMINFFLQSVPFIKKLVRLYVFQTKTIKEKWIFKKVILCDP